MNISLTKDGKLSRENLGLLLGFLAAVFDGRAGPFVGPARQGLSKMRGEDGVGYFVRQHRVRRRSIHCNR